MADVELRHLATMAAIVEEGTFGRAGGPKPVRITPPGAVVVEHGRDLLAKAEEIAAEVAEVSADLVKQ